MRRERLYLLDIQKAAKKIAVFIDGKDFAAFLTDVMTYDATVRNLQIIGEAAMNLPEEIRILHPEIPWKKIVGARHLIVHQYFGLDEEIVWNMASKYSPELLQAVEDILDSTSSE